MGFMSEPRVRRPLNTTVMSRPRNVNLNRRVKRVIHYNRRSGRYVDAFIYYEAPKRRQRNEGTGSSDATNARSLPNLKKVKALLALLDNVDIDCFALLYDVAESPRRDFNDDVPQFVHLCDKQNVRRPFPFFHPFYFSSFLTSFFLS